MERPKNSFDDFCRICTAKSDDAQNLFETIHNGTALAEMLGICLKRPINLDDGLPKNICTSCENHLKSTYEFHCRCEASEEYFLKQFISNSFGKEFSSGMNIKRTRTNQNSEVICTQIKTETDNEVAQLDANFDYSIKNDEPTFASELVCVEENFDVSNIINENEQDLTNLSDPTWCQSTNKEEQPPKNDRCKIGKRVYECYDCKKRFDGFIELKRHMNQHDNSQKPFECTTCNIRFVHLNSWFRHRSRHTKNIHECEYCSKAFDTISRLKFHIQDMHKEQMKAYKCQQCDEVFALHFLLVWHMEWHKKAKKFTCTTCDAVFFSERKLKAHIRDNHASK